MKFRLVVLFLFAVCLTLAYCLFTYDARRTLKEQHKRGRQLHQEQMRTY